MSTKRRILRPGNEEIGADDFAAEGAKRALNKRSREKLEGHHILRGEGK